MKHPKVLELAPLPLPASLSLPLAAPEMVLVPMPVPVPVPVPVHQVDHKDEHTEDDIRQLGFAGLAWHVWPKPA